MIHLNDTSIADTAVMRPLRLVGLAAPTEPLDFFGLERTGVRWHRPRIGGHGEPVRDDGEEREGSKGGVSEFSREGQDSLVLLFDDYTHPGRNEDPADRPVAVGEQTIAEKAAEEPTAVSVEPALVKRARPAGLLANGGFGDDCWRFFFARHLALASLGHCGVHAGSVKWIRCGLGTQRRAKRLPKNN